MTPPVVRQPGDLRWETRALVLIVAVLTVFGIASLYDAAALKDGGFAFALKQISGAALGGIALVIASRVDYHRWRALGWPLLLITLVCLVIPLLPFTLKISPLRHGARRWINLGPMQFQPSELAKFAIVLWTAMLAAKKGTQVREFKKGVLPFILVSGLVALLVLREPNLSMATLLALLGGVVLFSAGAKIGHFALLGLAAVLLVIHKIQDTGYRYKRILSFLNPNEGTKDVAFQLHQSLIGLGSGRLFGVGFGHGKQKLNYLPYSYSDFLFSSIGEEWGFIGVLVIVLLFGIFCWLGFRIARTAPDAFGQFLATGVTAAVGISAVMHMAVTIGLMPPTGLTLPFMSYGRSSLTISLFSVGILVNIGRMRGRPIKSDD